MPFDGNRYKAIKRQLNQSILFSRVKFSKSLVETVENAW